MVTESRQRVHESRIPIRWRDLDPLGHVNNAVYLTYLEEVRDGWLRQLPGGLDPSAFVIARIAIDFRDQLKQADGWVIAHCHLHRIGDSSIETREELALADGRIMAEAQAVLVAWDLEAEASRSLSDAERRALSS